MSNLPDLREDQIVSVEKKVLRDLAEATAMAVARISRQPVALSLIPIKSALTELVGVYKTLEKIAE